MQRIPSKLLFGLFLAIALDTAVQLTWKVAAARLPDSVDAAAIAAAVINDPIFAAVAVLMLSQLFNWLRVLSWADVSFAQPITALSYVSVCALSAHWLGEGLDAIQMLGIGAILAGVWLVSRTHRAPSVHGVVAP